MNHESNDQEQVEHQIEGHTYDGIAECDNPMPDWWIWTFLLAIIFAFIYFIHYSVGGGPTLTDELNQAMAEIEKAKTQEPVLDENENVLEEQLKKSDLALGAKVYSEKCSVCHGPELQGLIGPNLTDHYWIHGKGTRMDIVKVIRQGVPDKGMPSWGTMLNRESIYAVTAFILSKLDSSPSNPKAPQGDLVK